MAYVPPMKPIPKNADAETRRRMYWEYVDLCVELNPGSFLPVGVKKKWWHFLKIEHPETSRSRSDISHPIWPPPQSRSAETRKSLRAAGAENCELEDELSELRAAVRALLDGVNARYPDKKPREWTCQHMEELDRLVPPQGDGKQ